jgi:outer membrane lipoprotein-sorting protein
MVAVVIAVLLACPSAQAGNTVPAVAAFDAMFATVDDYSYDLHAHEVRGAQTQDRVYNFQFLRPSYAKSLILEGDDKGGGAVWTGGSEVSAHRGGLIAGLHAKLDLNDPRVVSLRGFTTVAGLIQNIVGGYKDTSGTLTQADGGTVGSVQTDRVDLKIADPARYDGVTEQILYLDRATHWPVRQIVYAGSEIVMDAQFTDIKVNIGLRPSDFPF